jgi:GTP-binding protein HflX
VNDDLASDAPGRAILCAVQLPDVTDRAFESSLSELGRLARTLGYTVAGSVTQKRSSFHAGSYLGSGKLEELTAAVSREGAAYVLVDHEISPSQARNLETASGAEVLDRTAVILEIFHRHARSRAAKAQVEIVRLEYMAPRLREQGKGRDRQRGGIGGKGAGESALELDRRKIRDRIAELTEELSSLQVEQETRAARRRDLHRVALVGYTNAGKSTLMRGLTGSEVYVADKLFATLDTTVRVMMPEGHPRVLVSDTVGFIENLPHGLVASFKTTLDEALEASLLLHVVDCSDDAWERQLQVTADVLSEIGAGAMPRLMVFNKIDRVLPTEAQVAMIQRLLAKWPDAVIMSAREPGDVRHMRERILEFFRRSMIEEEFVVPYDRQDLRGPLFSTCEVLDERYDEGGVRFRVRGEPDALRRIRETLTGERPDA